MGGQGKTQIALEFCRQAQRGELSCNFGDIFWVDAAESSTVSKSFAAMATKFSPKQVFQDTESQIQYAKHALAAWTVAWLTVFDNYDDPEDFSIREFFPSSRYGHVLVTTRDSSLSSLGPTVSVPGMTESQALQLLLSQSGIDATPENTDNGKAIVNRLGYLPLAVSQAAAYLSKRRDTMDIKDFLKVYEHHIRKSSKKPLDYGST